MDDEFIDEDWADDDDDFAETIDCPNCGAEVYELADSCPNCGEFIVSDTRPLTGKPMWFLVLGAAGIVALILAGLVGM